MGRALAGPQTLRVVTGRCYCLQHCKTAAQKATATAAAAAAVAVAAAAAGGGARWVLDASLGRFLFGFLVDLASSLAGDAGVLLLDLLDSGCRRYALLMPASRWTCSPAPHELAVSLVCYHATNDD